MKQVAFNVRGRTKHRRKGQPSTRKSHLYDAIALFCIECMGGDSVDNMRQEICNCTSDCCSLYEFRPYQHLRDEE